MRRAGGINQDVSGLNVPVENAPLMGMGNGPRDLSDQPGCVALEIEDSTWRGDRDRASAGFGNLSGFRFDSKAPKLAFGGSGSGANQFEGNTSVQTDLARVENDTHAAFGDFPH